MKLSWHGSRRARRFAGLLSLTPLANLGACAALEPPPPVSFSQEDWTYAGSRGTRLTTEHYEIFTTCRSKGFVQALPGFMEHCWDAYAALLPPQHVPPSPLRTYLFQTRWEWERFTREFTPDRAEVYRHIRSGGYTERGVTVSHYSSARSALSILAHEGLHQYLDATHAREVPAWLNEGLACYFESFDLDEHQRLSFRPENNTLRSPGLREALAANRFLPLRDILSTHAGQEIQKNASHVSSYYAQEWSLVVFMMRESRNNPYRDGFMLLLRELGTDEMERKARGFMAADTGGQMGRGEAIFRAYVTDDLDAFEVHYRSFLEQFLDMRS